jgi:hypothetical protein
MNSKVEQLSQEQLGKLDDGIRETVKWLREQGFNTTDSGDGSKAAAMECAFNYPNVIIALDDPDTLIFEADRLQECLEKKGVIVEPQGFEGEPYIQATYDPADGSVAIFLAYVDDEKLFGIDD